MVALAFLLFPSVVTVLFGIGLGPRSRFELHLMQWGIGWSGLLALGWGVQEFFVRKPGPHVLLSLLLLIPALLPFGFFGFGSDPDAWSVAHGAYRMNQEGGYLMSRPPGFPLFEGLARIVVPSAGWPGLFIANLSAGIAGCLVWLALPSSLPEGKKRLIAILTFVHPLYLLACGTGLETVWQSLFVTVALVLLIRGLETREPWATASLCASGLALGLASGFRITSLALVPVFVLVPLISPLGSRSKTRSLLLLLGATLATALVCEAPVLLKYGLGAIRFPSDGSDPFGLFHLIRFALPPPLLLLLSGALVALPFTWRFLKDSERALVTLAVAALAVLAPTFFLAESGSLTVLASFLAILCGLAAPRGLHAVCLPTLLLWGFLSIPVLSPQPGLRWKPEAGPLVEEWGKRFESMREAQQMLSISPKKPTVALVGPDWTRLAALRPNWKIGASGTLSNPDFPIEFIEGIDLETFQEMRASGKSILVIGSGNRFTQKKFGYGPLAEGAKEWEPGTLPNR
jgi:hypothetical protein